MIAGGNGKDGSRVGYPLFASDLNQAGESIKKIIRLSPSIIHTSHGEPCKKEVLEKLVE